MSKFTQGIRELINRPPVKTTTQLDAFALSRQDRIRSRLTPTPEQWRHLGFFLASLCVIVVAYQFQLTRMLLYPFELISTVFHEFGHALMTVATGGHVASIEINPDESGVTRFVGGAHCLILPAGYIGSSVAGAALLILSFGRRSSRAATLGTGLVLLATLYWSASIFTAASAVFMVLALAAVYFYRQGRLLQLFVLFMGTIGSVVSLLSISAHLISRHIDGSDASEFARHCSMLIPSSVYGVIWFILSGLIIIGSLLAGICMYK